MSTTLTFIGVLSTADVKIFTNVQRATIFMWFVTALITLIVMGVKLFSNNLDPDGSAYEQKQKGAKETTVQSSEAFDKVVIKSQIMTQDDTGTLRLIKKISKFSTALVPLTIPFALCLSVGASYAFSLVLYFLLMIPLILFNLLQFHRWKFEHKVFLCICDNFWLIGIFFWLLNIWTTGKYPQPYFLYQITQ